MKLIHFSDTHLGFNDLDVVSIDGINQREADFYKAFRDVIDAILEKKPDFVIHTGDLFHRPSPSNRAISVALRELKRVEEANIPFIVIAGNHSTPKTITTASIFEIFDGFKNIYAAFSQKYEKFEFEKVAFHCLAHINDPQKSLKEIEKIENSLVKNKKNILLMHCSVGAHYLMGEFGEWVFPKEKESIFKKFDYVALGHWHGFGSVKGYDNVYYSGSTERTSSSDKRDEKGYVEVFLDDFRVNFCKIDLRKMFTFILDAQNLEDELLKVDFNKCKDALVEVVLTNLTPQSSIDIPNSLIQKYFKNALSIKIKREFKNSFFTQKNLEFEAMSIKEHFVSFVKEQVSHKEESKRLEQKISKLFLQVEEEYDDN